MDRGAKEDRGYAHIPVMLEEVLALAPAGPAPWILDATFGRGGHSRALLARLGPEARLFALDRDPEALVAARALAQKTLALPWWPVPSAPWPKPWRPIFKAGGLMAC